MMFDVQALELPVHCDTFSFRHPTDEEVERAKRLVAGHLRRPPHRRIRVRPQPGEVGPACAACTHPLDRAQELVACPRCLQVSHEACWPKTERCFCERPRRRGAGFSPS